jgi:hypothetical protein
VGVRAALSTLESLVPLQQTLRRIFTPTVRRLMEWLALFNAVALVGLLIHLHFSFVGQVRVVNNRGG